MLDRLGISDEDWQQTPASVQQAFSSLITGDPGAGKSAVAAQIVRLSNQCEVPPMAWPRIAEFLSAYHFCRDRDDTTLSPLRFVKGISQQLASKHPEFATMLAAESDTQARVIIEANQQVGVLSKVSCAASVRDRVFVGDCGGALYFLSIDG